jgi:hypothetical protein
MIGEYNTYMGGVDVANLSQMHCNLMLMGRIQWWLKLFFYLFDVYVSNAMVLYKEAMGMDNNEMNMVDFQKSWY